MKEIIKARTKKLGIEVLKMIEGFPSNAGAWAVAKQISRSSTSIGAYYRAACRAKSDADFINKLKIVEEEADETAYWLEIIDEMKLAPSDSLAPLLAETNEIISIIVASIKTARSKIDSRR